MTIIEINLDIFISLYKRIYLYFIERKLRIRRIKRRKIRREEKKEKVSKYVRRSFSLRVNDLFLSLSFSSSYPRGCLQSLSESSTTCNTWHAIHRTRGADRVTGNFDEARRQRVPRNYSSLSTFGRCVICLDIDNNRNNTKPRDCNVLSFILRTSGELLRIVFEYNFNYRKYCYISCLTSISSFTLTNENFS